MLHLQVVQAVTFIVAFALASTRILSASRAFWSVLPTWLAGILPSLIVAVPALGQAVVGAQTWTDLTVAFLTAGALLLPGAHSHTVDVKPPSGPGAGIVVLVLLLVPLAIFSSACGWLKGSVVPDLEHCAPSTSELVGQVRAILLDGSSVTEKLNELEKQAGKDGLQVIACAVQQAIDELQAGIQASPERSAAVARGKAYLASKGAK